MFLRNTHIKEPFRIHITEPFQSRTVRHSGCHRHQLRVKAAQFTHNRGKHIGIGSFLFFVFGNSCLNIKGLRSMEPGRMALCRGIPLPFFGFDMNHHCALHFLGVLKHPHHLRYIVAIHRAEVFHSKVFKKHSRNHQLFNAILGVADPFYHTVAVNRNLVQCIFHACFQFRIRFRCSQITQIFRETAHIFGNGHLIVIQDNNKICLELGCVVQSLVGHAAGQGAIPDHRHHRVAAAKKISGFCIS